MRRPTGTQVLASALTFVGIVAITLCVWTFVQVVRQVQRIDVQVQRVDDGLARQKAERSHNQLVQCEETNRRHDNAVATLDRIIDGLPSAQRAQAHTSRAFTVQLIQALDPKIENCQKLADQRVK